MIDISKGRYWDLPWSLIDGCTPCSPGCDHCWSAGMTHRFQSKGKDDPVYINDGLLTSSDGRFNSRVYTRPDRLSIPLSRRKPAVYSCWNDLHHEAVPEEFIREAHWTMQRCGWHTFLVLTKRPESMVDFFSTRQDAPFLDNLFYGLTVCNQQEAGEKIPIFLQVLGKKFLSIEPMLGPIELDKFLFRYSPRSITGDGDGWDKHASREITAVILGGETGPGARPMRPDWVRSVRDQCAAAGVPFFFKQWGEWRPTESCGCDLCEGKVSRKVGRKVAGRLLDGRTHDDLPWKETP